MEVNRKYYDELKNSIMRFDHFIAHKNESWTQEEIDEERTADLWDISFAARDIISFPANDLTHEERKEISAQYYDQLKERTEALNNLLGNSTGRERQRLIESREALDCFWAISFSSRELYRSTRNMYEYYVENGLKSDREAGRISEKEYHGLYRNVNQIAERMTHLEDEEYKKARDDVLEIIGLSASNLNNGIQMDTEVTVEPVVMQ